jgi:hypothetical protein
MIQELLKNPAFAELYKNATEINVEENENKTLIVENKINYFNYYILNPFYYLYDCCKKLYFNFYAL